MKSFNLINFKDKRLVTTLVSNLLLSLLFSLILAPNLMANICSKSYSSNLINNGDFSNYSNPSRGWSRYGSGYWAIFKNMSGWQISGTQGIEVQKWGNTNFIELDVYGNESIWQDVVVEPGSYVITYIRAPRREKSPTTSAYDVYLGNKLVYKESSPTAGTISHDVLVNNSDMQNGKVRLKFIAKGQSDGLGIRIRNVSMKKVTGVVSDETQMPLTKNLVKNGLFTNYSTTLRNWSSYYNGVWAIYKNLQDWNISSSQGIEIQKIHGVSYVELDVYSNTTISQDIAAEPGYYILSFNAWARPEKINSSSGYSVYISDKLVHCDNNPEKFVHNIVKGFLISDDEIRNGKVTLKFVPKGTADGNGIRLSGVSLMKAPKVNYRPSRPGNRDRD